MMQVKQLAKKKLDFEQPSLGLKKKEETNKQKQHANAAFRASDLNTILMDF